MSKPNVLFENEAYVVCEKPSGIMSEDGKVPGMPSLLSPQKPLLTVHRLDREVYGVTVYAKRSKAAASLSQQMQENSFIKEYVAVVEGSAEESGRYEDLLFKDSSKNKSFVVKRERRGVKKAILGFEKISETVFEGKELSLVKIKLYTGRTHQIRVQFSHRKHPVFGDRKYGSGFDGGFGLMLKKIGFKCPETGEYREFATDFPKALPWSLFELNENVK